MLMEEADLIVSLGSVRVKPEFVLVIRGHTSLGLVNGLQICRRLYL